jgi:hypothetical protein
VVTISADSNGLVGILWAGIDTAISAYWGYYFSLWNGSSWNASQALSILGDTYYTPADGADMVVGSDDKWHITFCQKHSSSPISPALFYSVRTSGSGGTCTRTQLSANNSNSTVSNVLLDSSGYVIVTHRNNSSTFINAYTNRSGSWVNSASTQSGAASFSQIASTNDVYYLNTNGYSIGKFSTASAWSTVTATGRILAATGATFGMDTSDNLYIGMRSVTQKFTGGAWADPVSHSTGSADQSTELIRNKFAAGSMVYRWSNTTSAQQKFFTIA